MTPALSVVVPVYRCAPCLAELHRRLGASLEEIAGGYELLFVEDGGNDDSWAILRSLAEADSAVRAIKLSRNFGQHAAITAGIERARGSWIAVMDCDLQDPPEELPRLFAKASEGYEIVYGRRRRKRSPLARTLLSKLYFQLIRTFTGVPIESDYGTLSIISRKVADAFLAFQDRNRHYLFILRWLGFTHTELEYEHASRTAGASSYTLRLLARHAVQGIFFQTTVLLRWVVYLGFLVAFAGVVAAVYFSVARLTGTLYPGWTSLIVLMLLLSGVIIIGTGVIGLYVGEVFNEARRRPLFVVETELSRVGDDLSVRSPAGDRHAPEPAAAPDVRD